MFKKLNNIGDSGVVCDFGDEVSKAINGDVIKLFKFITNEANLGNIEGILNCAPSYNKLIISFDLKKTNAKKVSNYLKSIDFSKIDISRQTKEWIVPICYDFELDMKDISDKLKIKKEEIIKIHSKITYFIYMVGFIPGHPFMGDLDSKLFLNRLKTPRVKVPAGSVGIVEKFCNIYPYESPGGWNIIGKTPIRLFNNQKTDNPCLLTPGDTVRFKSISKEEFKYLQNEQ